MNQPVRKDSFYFKLFERLDTPGCPICGIVIDDSRAYLDSVLYERVTDVPTRMGLRDSFGLCNLHTWLLRDVPASSAPDLGFAIIAKDLLSRFERMAGEPPVVGWRALKGWLGRTRSRLRAKLKTTRCPACVHAARSESVHLRQLLDLLDEGGTSPRNIVASASLTSWWPKKPRASTRIFAQLRKVQIRKARSLHDTLDRFVEKNDHRAKEEITSAEARAWTGRHGVPRREAGLVRQRAAQSSPAGSEQPLQTVGGPRRRSP